MQNTHCAIIALNLALVTLILPFPCLHTFTISIPILSPSRSQSVQIITSSAPRASARKFSAIALAPLDTRAATGVSNSTKGSHELQERYAPKPPSPSPEVKSYSVRWPATAVTVTEARRGA